ncbi:MAG: hypothetical protein QM813_18785 [Verrucomicrobiota bacterium]
MKRRKLAAPQIDAVEHGVEGGDQLLELAPRAGVAGNSRVEVFQRQRIGSAHDATHRDDGVAADQVRTADRSDDGHGDAGEQRTGQQAPYGGQLTLFFRLGLDLGGFGGDGGEVDRDAKHEQRRGEHRSEKQPEPDPQRPQRKKDSRPHAYCSLPALVVAARVGAGPMR